MRVGTVCQQLEYEDEGQEGWKTALLHDKAILGGHPHEGKEAGVFAC